MGSRKASGRRLPLPLVKSLSLLPSSPRLSPLLSSPITSTMKRLGCGGFHPHELCDLKQLASPRESQFPHLSNGAPALLDDPAPTRQCNRRAEQRLLPLSFLPSLLRHPPSAPCRPLPWPPAGCGQKRQSWHWDLLCRIPAQCRPLTLTGPTAGPQREPGPGAAHIPCQLSQQAVGAAWFTAVYLEWPVAHSRCPTNTR